MFEEKITHYDPSASDEFIPLPKGNYKARIHAFDFKKTWTNNDNQVADIYEATYKLDPSVSEMTLRDENGKEFDGNQFTSREVRSKGLFLWKSPGKGDSFVTNPAGNKRIFIFLKSVGYPLNKKEVENEKGVKVNVVEIPEVIDESQFMGAPVLIEVMHEEYKGKYYAKEHKISKWENAPEVEVNEDDDVPF